METEFRVQNAHVLKLNNAESTNDIDNAKGYVDSDGVFHPVTEDE